MEYLFLTLPLFNLSSGINSKQMQRSINVSTKDSYGFLKAIISIFNEELDINDNHARQHRLLEYSGVDFEAVVDITKQVISVLVDPPEKFLNVYNNLLEFSQINKELDLFLSKSKKDFMNTRFGTKLAFFFSFWSLRNKYTDQFNSLEFQLIILKVSESIAARKLQENPTRDFATLSREYFYDYSHSLERFINITPDTQEFIHFTNFHFGVILIDDIEEENISFYLAKIIIGFIGVELRFYDSYEKVKKYKDYKGYIKSLYDNVNHSIGRYSDLYEAGRVTY